MTRDEHTFVLCCVVDGWLLEMSKYDESIWATDDSQTLLQCVWRCIIYKTRSYVVVSRESFRIEEFNIAKIMDVWLKYKKYNSML